MNTPYGITINMDQNTVDSLLAADCSLCAFKAVQGPSNGTPLVWFQTRQLTLNTEITWTKQYQAYSSGTQIQSGATIVAGHTYPVNMGDMLTINGPDGAGDIDTDGNSPVGVEIYNNTNKTLSAGITQLNSSGKSSPTCAFTLFGQMDDIVIPVEHIMLMFSANPVNTGAVITNSFSQGIIVNLTNINSRTVSYGLHTGWSTGGQPGMAIYPPKTAMQPLLIQSYTSSIKLSRMLAFH